MRIDDDITIPDWALTFVFVRSPGPGGQNVNKVATGVQLRAHVAAMGLAPDVARRLATLAGRRLTRDGDILIEAHRHRTQVRNREDALERLAELVRAALVRPKRRIKTRPSLSAKRRRTDAKTRRGDVKSLRRRPARDD